jgi:hypothetical protein
MQIDLETLFGPFASTEIWFPANPWILVMALIVGENFVSSDPKHLDRHALQVDCPKFCASDELV